MTSKVLVLGGTGLLGHATIEELVARGYEVISLALPPMPTEDLFEPFGDKVTSHLGDVAEMSDEEILALLEGVHGVMYAVGADERTVPPAPAARFFYEANVLVTQRVAALARKAGVKKFVVYGSYFAEFAERMPELGLKDHGYPCTRLLQEQIAFAEGDGAMDVTSLRLPYIFGTMPGRMPLWKMFVDQIKGQPVFPAHPGGITAAVTTKQVGQAAVGAMERGEHRHTYALGGYNLSHQEFYEKIVKALGQDTQVPLVPFEAIEPALKQADDHAAANGLEHGIHMVLSGRVRALDLGIDPAPVREQLGYEDDDVLAAIDETLAVCLAEEKS